VRTLPIARKNYNVQGRAANAPKTTTAGAAKTTNNRSFRR